eukprot:2688105-Amphidinium_carterae.1
MWKKPLENCWFNDPNCQHWFCEQHGKIVGFFTTAGMNIKWCNCHDAVALPCAIEDWERYIPDSDGEFLGDGDEEIIWDKDERQR